VTVTICPKNVIHENPMEIDIETSNTLLAKHRDHQKKKAEANKIREDANRIELPAEKD